MTNPVWLFLILALMLLASVGSLAWFWHRVVDTHPVAATRWPILWLLIFVVLSIALYLWQGHAMQVVQQHQQQQMNENADDMIQRLLPDLQDSPQQKTTDQWLLLGRTLMVLERVDLAVTAYEKAYVTDATRVDVLLPLADTLAVMNQGQLNGRPFELIEQALQQSPDNHMALWLAGIAEQQAGEYEEARRHWLRLYHLKSPSDPDKSTLKRQLMAIGTPSDAFTKRPLHES